MVKYLYALCVSAGLIATAKREPLIGETLFACLVYCCF